MLKELINEIKSSGVEAIFYNVNAADEFKRNEIITEIKSFTKRKAISKSYNALTCFWNFQNSFVPSETEQAITKAQMEMTLDVMAHSLVYWVQDVVANNLLVTKCKNFCNDKFGKPFSNTILWSSLSS
ncbi:MAG: hypothetical protein MZV64_38700 [Ignavibacteriales bacterium]|nr:hypothetical protein [Ignavibacteriales bacterium]